MSKSVKNHLLPFLLETIIIYFIVFANVNLLLSFQENYSSLSKHYLFKGDSLKNISPDSAVFYYQLGLKELETEKKSTLYSILRIDLLNKIGQIFHQQSKYDFAEEYYFKGLSEAEKINNDSLMAESHFNIAEINLENGVNSFAIDSYLKALELFEKTDNTEGIYWCQIGLGIVYRGTGNAGLSKTHYELATEIGKKQNREDYIAISYNNLGNLHKQLGEYDKAIELLQLALNSFEKFGEKKFISDCLDSIGELYAEINNHYRAIEYFNKSIEIAESLNDNYRLLALYANIAKSYAAINSIENALMYFSKTIELAQSIGDKARLSEIFIMLADFYKSNNDLDNALDKLKNSLIISREVGDTVSIASALNLLSEIYFQKKDYQQAYNNALESYRISSQKNLMNTLAKSSYSIAHVLELQSNFKDALYYYRIYNKTQDLLLNAEKIKILEETEAKYNLAKIEKEKLQLENASLTAEEKVQQRNSLILVLIIVILLSTGAGVWYLHKKNKEKYLFSQKSAEMKNKIDQLNNKISEKNRELTSKALFISQNNEVLKNVVESIDKSLIDGTNERKDLQKLKRQLKEIYEEKSWNDFLHHFEQVHPMFYKTIIEKCGDLSSMEQKICAFIKMNLNTKDISQITGQSIKAIEVMRSRIRKKLEIPHEESLSKAIQRI